MNDMRQDFEQHPLHESVVHLEEQLVQINNLEMSPEHKQHIREIKHFIMLIKETLNALTGPLYPFAALNNINKIADIVSTNLQADINNQQPSCIKDCHNILKQYDYPLFYLLQSKQDIAAPFDNMHEILNDIDKTFEIKNQKIENKTATMEQMLQKQQEHIDKQQQEIDAIKVETENKLNEFIEQNLKGVHEEAQVHADNIAELFTIAAGQVTGEKYTEFAKKLDRQAFWQQWTGIIFAIVAVFLAIFLPETSQQFHWGDLLGRLSVTSILLFISVYLLTAASNKRKEAKKYRQASLLSLSLEGFVAEMTDEEMKQNFRMMIGERLYRPDDADIKIDEESSFFNIGEKVKGIMTRKGTTDKTPPKSK